MIYFIGNEEYVKIGYSKDSETLKKRLCALQTGCPFIIETFLIISGGLLKEKELHTRFRKDNSSGEWFFMSKEIREFIDENIFNSLYAQKNTKSEDFLTLKDLRKLNNISLREAGEAINITPQSAKEIEDRFDKETISLKGLKKYAGALGYNIHINFISKSK